jgi:hypothetical protein
LLQVLMGLEKDEKQNKAWGFERVYQYIYTFLDYS